MFDINNPGGINGNGTTAPRKSGSKSKASSAKTSSASRPSSIVGEDGHTYYWSDQLNNYVPGFDGISMGGGNPAGSTYTANSTSDTGNDFSGSGTGTTYKDTSAARGATQKNIEAVDKGLGNSIKSITDNFDRIIKQYTDESNLNKAEYGRQTEQNELTRSRNNQQSLLAATQGRRGLMAVLASMNALGGTGNLLADRAVATEANRDIGEGNRAFEDNATQLTSSYDRLTQDEKNREAEARAARAAQEADARRQAAKEKQSLYERMAGLWGDAGNTAEANRYTNMVGDIAGDVVGSYVPAAAYTPRNLAFEGGQMKNYLAGANDMTVQTAGGDQAPVNSPLYALTRRREEKL